MHSLIIFWCYLEGLSQVNPSSSQDCILEKTAALQGNAYIKAEKSILRLSDLMDENMLCYVYTILILIHGFSRMISDELSWMVYGCCTQHMANHHESPWIGWPAGNQVLLRLPRRCPNLYQQQQRSCPKFASRIVQTQDGAQSIAFRCLILPWLKSYPLVN